MSSINLRETKKNKKKKEKIFIQNIGYNVNNEATRKNLHLSGWWL